MEQVRRNSGGVYTEHIPSNDDLTSGSGHPFAQLQQHHNPDPFADPAAAHASNQELPTAAAAPAAEQQPRTPFYKKKKFIISQIVVAILGIIILFVLLFPVVKAIAQHVINVSVINVQTASIQNPQNTTFTLHMTGFVSHTGIIPARIEFTEPTQISWVKDGNMIHLGTIQKFPDISASHKTANIDVTVPFQISEEEAFSQFTQYMITQPSFTWLLHSENLKVHALKFPVAKGIHFNKTVVLNGINNFAGGNIQLVDFKLPQDDPAGGITFSAVTSLTNKSPFQVDLGNTLFNLTYNDIFLGQGTSTNTQLSPGPNTITLDGHLLAHNGSDSELVSLGNLFTSYINGETSQVIAKGVSTTQADGQQIGWLSQGLQALSLNVPFIPPTPINPIQAIDIGYFNLSFSEENPWAPLASSDEIAATMKLPFGFSVNISQIMNSFAINQNNTNVANLTTPLGASVSDIRVFAQDDTHGTINITLKNVPLNIPDAQHQSFALFNEQLTDGNASTFQLIGGASAVAEIPIGTIKLDSINFNVTSNLLGLQGLQGATVIKTVDVAGGTTDHILLNIGLSIHNPSNLNLDLGDLNLQLFSQGALLGTSLLSKLSLLRGDNNLVAQGFFEPNNSPEGLATLNAFVAGQNTTLNIAGYSGSTNISSLLPAFESLAINTTLPGLGSTLLKSASLEVLPTTGHANSIAHVTVNLDNPFTGGLTITSINSSVHSHGVLLGSINTTTNFVAAGKKVSTSPTLDLNMNLDPPSVFSVLRALAIDAGMSTEQLDGIVQLGGYQYVPTTGADSVNRNSTQKRSLESELGFDTTSPVLQKRNIYSGFNLPSYVDKAFKNLRTDIDITSGVSIGDYKTMLQFTQEAVPVITDSSLNLLLPILAQPIVQKVVDASLLGIETVLITDPAEKSFGTQLAGSITNAGPFDAKISFPEGLTIFWSGSPLGKINMPDVTVVGDVGAKINNKGTFEVADVNHLTEFTKTLLTAESFDWTITGDNLTVSALGITVPGISLGQKNVTLKAFNGLKNGVKINSFDLPSDDPAGGIHLTLKTTVTNPSQVGISLSSIGFQNFIGSTHLGPAQSASAFTMAPNSSFDLPLVGRLIPQSTDDGLATISQVFTDFIHGKSSQVTVNGDSAGPSSVTWLNEAIKVLSLTTTLPDQGKLDVIKSINLNELKLLFSDDTAYNPATSTDDATAAFQLPFAFPLNVVQVGQTITANYKGSDFATLDVPMGPSTTDVKNRIIHLTFQNVPFAVHGDGHEVFQQFLKDTTASKSETFSLSGSANTKAETAVGLLTISDIAFSNLATTIAGLQNLNARPAAVSNLDVNHGFPDYLLIKVNTQLFNPSNLTIGTGDVAFNLQFQGKTIGMADLDNLLLVPGSSNYSTDVHYQPSGDAEGAGQALLANYVQGVDSDTTISGSDGTTDIDSLKPALAQITLSATIPALHQNLITSTHIVFPIDIVKTGIATATFDLANPFTASINLLRISTAAIFQNITLGTIDVDQSSNPIHAGGHSNITSPSLPLKFNLEPSAIIDLLTIRAQQKHIDLGPLPDLFGIALANPHLGSSISSVPDTKAPTCVSGKQFDVDSAILNALEGLQADLQIKSSVKLDDFETPLNFAQHNVPAVTDKTALFLIGAVANPVTQTLVNQAELSFKVANISNLSNDGFDLALEGSLTNTGPLDALIEFTEPVTVTWQGRKIAGISLPPACAAANVGIPNYTPKAHLSITDLGAFTDFATFLLHNEEFTWDLSSSAVRVTALDTIFSGVTLEKSVTFKAFNGLPGVTISNFKLPSDSPQGGITISTDSKIPSPAQLGINLGTVTFESFYKGVDVGPLTGQHLFLAAETSTNLHLDGRIIPQSGDHLNTLGELFSDFLQGKNSTLQVKGVSVDPNGNGQDVSWLSTAFKTLTLDVILPGEGNLTIIESITIEDLEVVINENSEAFAPLASSKDTLAIYKNPFGFSLQVIEAATQIVLGSGGVDAAQLNLPKAPANGGVSTGNPADLQLSFQNQTLKSLNNGAFAAFFGAVTDTASVTANLKGTADVTAKTAIGNVPISGIRFNVDTKIAGINSFGHTTTLSDVKITGSGGAGGSQYVLSPLITTLNNPSNISLNTVDISLPTFFKGVEIGRAVVNNFDLVPGKNTMPAEFHYQPANANDTIAQSFLTEYLSTGEDVPLTIKGDGQSSPFGSLIVGLEGVELSTALTGISAKLIQHINVYITVETLLTGFVSIDIDLSNPLDSDLTINFLQSDAGVNGVNYAHVDFAFNPGFVVPAHGTANTGSIPNVFLVQGVIASLDIIPLGELDVFSAITNQVGRNAGYQIPWLQYSQMTVPTAYVLPLGIEIGGLLPLAQSLRSSASASSVAKTAIPSTASTTPASPTDGGGSKTDTPPAPTQSQGNPPKSSPTGSPTDGGIPKITLS